MSDECIIIDDLFFWTVYIGNGVEWTDRRRTALMNIDTRL